MKSDPAAARFPLGVGLWLFLGVFALRLWELSRLTHSALLIPTRGDMHFYNDWARQILHGQFAQPLAFYGLPGYPYLLAFLYKLFGENPFVPGLFQAAADAGIALLIYRISINVFADAGSTSSKRARVIGLIGAVSWAFFVPAQTYSVVLMPTAWFVFVFWFVVWRIVRRDNSPSALEVFLLAILVGLTATAVATILAVVPLILAALLLKSRRANSIDGQLSTRTALVVLGLVLGTSPCWIHNYFIAKDPVALSAHSGINFWIGNNPDGNGYPRFPPGLRAGQAAMLEDSITQAEAALGRPLKHAEVSAYWSSKAKTFIRDHFLEWLELLARKLRNFWNAFQYDDLSIVTSLREQGVILPGLYFGIVAALAIPGIFFGWRRAQQSRWILAAVLLSICALLAVFITERYRLVAVPGLLIFAAFGLSTLWQAFIAREIGTLAVYLALLVVSTIFVAWPQRNPSLWALDAYNSGWQALESNHLDLAEKKLAVACAYVPDNSETLFALGNLRLAQNNRDAAQSFYRAVLNLDPQHKGAFNNLGVIAFDASQFDDAEKWFRRAEDVDPRNAKTHFLLAKTFLAKSDRASARDEIDAAIRLKPDQAEFTAFRQQIEQGSQ
ncbi:MAG TPA: tetratricopeptide repeat protein [Chthoniobacterales bacterium]